MKKVFVTTKSVIHHPSWSGGSVNNAARFALPLFLNLAFRDLLQDRLRFVATVVGIVFSIVLVTVQMGLFLSFERMVASIIDHASADLWVVSKGVQCFEDPSNLDMRDRDQVLAVPGVAAAIPVVIGFSNWAKPRGGTVPVLVIGSNPDQPGLRPWALTRGSLGALTKPDAVAIDQAYFGRLGVNAIGERTQIRGQTAEVVAITDGIRSFTTSPYVFTSIATARAYAAVPPDRVSYLLVHLSPGADRIAVRQQLLQKLSNVEILTTQEFSSRSRAFWLFGTGAGAALFAGALLGVIIGTIIIAQTLYASAKDHVNEFATLRALGSSNAYILKIIVSQAIFGAVVGFTIATGIGLIIVAWTASTALPIVMTPVLALALLVLTVFMCVASATAAIAHVLHVDPMMAFKS
jgi:putative ABC transport system permease protein